MGTRNFIITYFGIHHRLEICEGCRSGEEGLARYIQWALAMKCTYVIAWMFGGGVDEAFFGGTTDLEDIATAARRAGWIPPPAGTVGTAASFPDPTKYSWEKIEVAAWLYIEYENMCSELLKSYFTMSSVVLRAIRTTLCQVRKQKYGYLFTRNSTLHIFWYLILALSEKTKCLGNNVHFLFNHKTRSAEMKYVPDWKWFRWSSLSSFSVANSVFTSQSRNSLSRSGLLIHSGLISVILNLTIFTLTYHFHYEKTTDF